MDEKDAKILSTLQENSRLSTRQISKKTQLPITTIHNRIKKMNNEGIIKKYTVVPDYKKIGMKILAYVLLSVDYAQINDTKKIREDFEHSMGNKGIVENVSTVTGITDLILRIRTKGIEELDQFVVHELRKHGYVKKTQTMIALTDL
ncbi:MAG: Lrp/AsnC family transcriptional regulator [Nanoarchaeota archaeon]